MFILLSVHVAAGLSSNIENPCTEFTCWWSGILGYYVKWKVDKNKINNLFVCRTVSSKIKVMMYVYNVDGSWMVSCNIFSQNEMECRHREVDVDKSVFIFVYV